MENRPQRLQQKGGEKEERFKQKEESKREDRYSKRGEGGEKEKDSPSAAVMMSMTVVGAPLSAS